MSKFFMHIVSSSSSSNSGMIGNLTAEPSLQNFQLRMIKSNAFESPTSSMNGDVSSATVPIRTTKSDELKKKRNRATWFASL